MESHASDSQIPLCADLDGTLIRSDVLVEGFLRLVKTSPLWIFAAFFWLLRGRAYLKAQIARRSTLDVTRLPYNEPLLDWLRTERQRGRHLILCTAANKIGAESIARHLGIFDEVLSSDDTLNLSGREKARLLEMRFGMAGFDYAGNTLTDLHVWRVARRAIVVSPTHTLRRQLHRLPSIERQFITESPLISPWIRALRLHQWAKNLLIFVPAVVSHKFFELSVLYATLLAFICFGLCASATYVINDLLDLDADRSHARKRLRPFASGELPLMQGIACAAGLLTIGISISILLLGNAFVAVLCLYIAVTFWYSWLLKRIAMVDVLTLAGLYTIRVIAGGAAIAVEASFWLLAFSMFMFLSLGMVKRYTELRAALNANLFEASGRGYTTDDLVLLLSCGTSAGFISVLVMALYINGGTQHLYRHPQALWMLCPLMLYWVCRVWRKAHRGELHDDPVVFAISDRPSLLVVCLCVILIVVATKF